jgi:hypothetical protein
MVFRVDYGAQFGTLKQAGVHVVIAMTFHSKFTAKKVTRRPPETLRITSPSALLVISVSIGSASRAAAHQVVNQQFAA